ncbi:MAG TPA: DUF2851 family protein [Flavitalea sp.]|nr:DUF2851 family protein [Flavitalea sp.]
MTERLLQYIWQFQYFNRNELVAVTGEEIVIIHPGKLNTHQGPDFLEGRVRSGSNTWVGNIELHVDASEWHRHQHSLDKNYNNVILHVVWNNDEVDTKHGIPTLVLEDRVPKVLLQQYNSWMEGGSFIPCESSAQYAEDLVWTSWKERLMIERLQRKSDQVMVLLYKNNFHWEEVLWWMLARNFGLYVNADAFAEIAASIPFNVLLKHRMQIHQLEALLFGQCNLLEIEEPDKYSMMLQKEYLFLQKKYSLEKTHLPVHFLRMRPACFPTVRLAQLAMLVHTTADIFCTILNAPTIHEIRLLMNVTANDYWHYHFRFCEVATYQPKTLGLGMINNIMMNTVAVILFAYGKYHNDLCYLDKAVQWMSALPAEQNSTISRFKNIGVTAGNAADTQSLIELKSQYCDHKRCLECAVANAMFKHM